MNGIPINSIAATDTLTVLGSYQTNQLYAINLTASLENGSANRRRVIPSTFTPQPHLRSWAA